MDQFGSGYDAFVFVPIWKPNEEVEFALMPRVPSVLQALVSVYFDPRPRPRAASSKNSLYHKTGHPNEPDSRRRVRFKILLGIGRARLLPSR